MQHGDKNNRPWLSQNIHRYLFLLQQPGGILLANKEWGAGTMAKLKSPASEHEKERMRAEIDSQIEEFLRRGGKIDILNSDVAGGSSVGSVWHQQEDMTNLVQQ
jgi:predicted NUDIX family NTP pyrophosphohydrolase